MFKSILRILLWTVASLSASVVIVLAGMYLYLSPTLPAVDSLKEVKLQTPLQVYSADNQLIGEFGEKRRSPIRYEDIPETYINALLAAEDEGFYSHNGVSIKGLVRAASHLLITGEKKSGGSTITMQVTREFFLHRKKHFKRKFNEILLALRIEEQLSKEEILEIYVNMIFLGNRAYGIQAAAEIYYGKDINQLSTAQLAMIAGLQQAPSRNNPLSNPEGSINRRNWILGRMLELGSLPAEEYKIAVAERLTAEYHQNQVDFDAPYIAEIARQQAINLFGPEAYTDGYRVYTSIDTRLQRQAQNALVSGLTSYDNRHGYRVQERPPGDNLDLSTQLAVLKTQREINGLIPAIVTKITEKSVEFTFNDMGVHTESWKTLSDGLRLYETEDRTSKISESAADVLKVGDIIRVRAMTNHDKSEDKTESKISQDANEEISHAGVSESTSQETPPLNGQSQPALEAIANSWKLAQIPDVQGSLVSIDAYSGRVLALVGGYDFYLSSFNRATQAKRQPGSNFKPFLYASALKSGMTAATLINDAPVVFDDDRLETAWRPKNSSGRFYGPTRLRKALYLSRNLVSVRIMQQLGVNTFIKDVGEFGLDNNNLPRDLSLALGSLAMTPIDLVTGYGIFANGGYSVRPYIVDLITDDEGGIVYQSEKQQVCSQAPCERLGPFFSKSDSFTLDESTQTFTNATPKAVAAPRVMDEEIAYLMDSMLKDVILRGTGTKARDALKRSDLAGKTGTTNGPTDAWFTGYAAGIVTSAWVGFDDYDNLGDREYGGVAALPIWIDYMSEALRGKPVHRFPQPAGIISVRINPETGAPARIDDPDAIFEYFRIDNAPRMQHQSAPADLQNKSELESLF